MLYIILSFIAGIMVILSMITNSQLSKRIGVFPGAFVNYGVGLLFAIIVFIITKGYSTMSINRFPEIPIWAYLGGALGVIVVCISNVIIPKIPTIYSTLLIFIGQLFCGILLDLYRDGVLSKGKLIGGILILFGMLYNFYVDKVSQGPKVYDL
ncbi:MAG: DMT family transporter [Clostridiaceae bacterium]|nr:DMT family transporter [Clostridiaceae bacterium]